MTNSVNDTQTQPGDVQQTSDIFEGVDNIVDDLPKTPPSGDTEKADTKELVSGLQEQLIRLQNELNETRTESKAYRTEREELVDKFSKTVGWIEAAGIGKYDPETGSIIKQEPTAPEPDNIAALKQEMDSIQKDIKETERAINRRHLDGDLTREEKYLEIQEQIGPLKEKYNELKYEIKHENLKKELTTKKEFQQQTAQPKAGQPQTQIPYESNPAKNQINDFAKDFPDITDPNSDLFKKMTEIYAKNTSIYTDPNNSPAQYKDLIDRAVIELKINGVEISKQQQTIRGKFATPSNRGYDQTPKKDNHLTKDNLSMLISQNINSKSLISSINDKIADFHSTGAIVMDD